VRPFARGRPKWVRDARAVRYRADWLDQWTEDNTVYLS
jgi:hypothetical protein